MWSTLLVLVATDAVYGLAFEKSHGLKPRLDNGLGKTPALGWNSWVKKTFSFIHCILNSRQLEAVF